MLLTCVLFFVILPLASLFCMACPPQTKLKLGQVRALPHAHPLGLTPFHRSAHSPPLPPLKKKKKYATEVKAAQVYDMAKLSLFRVELNRKGETERVEWCGQNINFPYSNYKEEFEGTLQQR